MCGRYRQTGSLEALKARFKAEAASPTLEPRLDIRPSEPAAVVTNEAGRRLEMLRWGLIPSWAKEATGPRPINARAETLAEKPAFRALLKDRRCLVPADGFYEWRPEPGREKKTKLSIRLPEGGLFAMAGLWDSWRDPLGRAVRTFTIVTVEASPALKSIHDRMPAILRPQDEDAWLDADTPAAEAARLLAPFSGPLLAYPAPETP